MTTTGDAYDLARFVDAQADDYERALTELRAGRKESHWMWFVFPQFAGLGASSTSRHFAIRSVGEARAYLAHPLLGPRLGECANMVMNVKGRSAAEIFGPVDAMKLRSSATLFAHVSSGRTVFHQIIDRYFDGTYDQRTLELLRAGGED